LGRRNGVYDGGLAVRREREHRRSEEEFSFLVSAVGTRHAHINESVVVGASRARNACGVCETRVGTRTPQWCRGVSGSEENRVSCRVS
jgi:hypothetical protein